MTVLTTYVGGYTSITVNMASFIFSPTAQQVGIYKGTVPTDFTTFSDPAIDRTSDLLVLWTSVSGQGVSTPRGYRLEKMADKGSIVATGSGTATWLWWHTGTTTKYNMIGTVGTIGSGADFEIFNTSIVAGQEYRFADIFFVTAGDDTALA